MVPTEKADELLKSTKVALGCPSPYAHGHGGRVVELSGRPWIENEFEWCNSMFSFEKE